MSDPSPSEVGAFNLDWRLARRYVHFARGFWAGQTARRAWTLSLSLATALLLSTLITVQMNNWNRRFFDALERRDGMALKAEVLAVFVIVACMAAIGVGIVITRMTLQIRWRQWLVQRLIEIWLDQQKFYHLNASGLEPPNPEYRISDDTRWATEMFVDLCIGLMTALTGGIAFIAILWSVGGAFHVGGVSVPGYMVWGALAYGIAASSLTAYVGSPLVGRVGRKNEAEGYFRFAMMRLRDNAESIAISKGGAAERQILRGFYDSVVGRWLLIVKSNAHLTWITNASGPLIPIVPLLFAAPKYMAGELTLGEVTQLAAAFVQVQQAISWVVDNYSRIADWYASARRVMDIVDASDAVEPMLPPARPGLTSPGSAVLTLSDVTLYDLQGRALLLPVSLSIKQGEAVYMHGAANTGKSTLARVIAGLMAPTRGSISGAPPQSFLLLPQKSYLPLGTLAEAMAYPHAVTNYSEVEIRHVLDQVGLSALATRLKETARWDQVLSTSERQRLTLARVFLAGPEIVIIDDALSALDGATQKVLIQKLREARPQTTILGLGQRAAVPGTYDRTIELAHVAQYEFVSTATG